MEKSTKLLERWWRVPLLLLALLLGGSSPTRAISFVNNDYTYIVSQPADGSGNYKQPYFEMVMLYYDWTTYANSFWVSAPEIYVDDVLVCTGTEIGQFYGNGSGDGTAASKVPSNVGDNWWGSIHDKTVDGIKYRVRFRKPFESCTTSNKRKFSCIMRVYISSMEAGTTHKVKIKGKWVYNRDSQIDIDKTWSFKAPTLWPDSYAPTCDMTDYNHLTASGQLNYSYGATYVGFYKDEACEAPTASSSYYSYKFVDKDALKSCKKYEYHNNNFSNQTATHNRNGDGHKDGSNAAIEYVLPVEDNGFYTNFYRWYNVGVPGFALPRNMTANSEGNHVWEKSVTLNWNVDVDWLVVGNNRRCKEGKWLIYRGNDNIGTIDYDKVDMTFDDKTVPNYDVNYTYKVYFVPKNSPSGTKIDKLSTTLSNVMVKRKWNIDSFTGALVDDDAHIKLTWIHNAINDASSNKPYTLSLYRSSDNGKTWGSPIKTFKIESSNITEGSHTDKDDLHAGRTYTYKLSINLLDKDYTITSAPVTLGGSQLTSFTASRGDYNNVVKLKWTVKQVGADPTSFAIARRPLGSDDEKEWATIHTTSGTGSSYSYDDITALQGTYNEYKVSIVDKDNPSLTFSFKTTDGFTYSTGVISGRIKYGTGTAVEGVKVKLKQQNADGDLHSGGMSSLQFSGAGAGMTCKTDVETVQKLFGKDFSIQMYLNPSSSEMNGSVSSYNLLHAIHIFYMSLTKSGNNYKLGAWVGGSTENSNLTIPADKWSHVTLVHNHDSMTTTLYVTAGDSVKSAVVRNGYQINWNKNGNNDPKTVDSLDIFSVAGLGPSVKNNFRGYVDEFRFYTKALSEKDILRNYNHTLAGNEDGLAIYYPFDEGLAKQSIAYDYSKNNGVANGRHARTGVPAYSSTEVPSEEQLCLMNYTDSLGNYTIRGIHFQGEGTAYSVIPEYNIHDFSPSEKSCFISSSSLVHSGVDFDDVSSFPVKGLIIYSGTDYPVEGCNLYVDGTICSKDGEVITTDAKGEFEISVPIGRHFIQVKKNGHVFVNDGRFPADPNNVGEKYPFEKEMSNLEFHDTTLVNFTGRVVGGSIEGNKNVGFGLSTNTIGVTELVLTPQDDTKRLNVLKTNENGVIKYPANKETVPIPSATDKIRSKSWRGANDADCNKLIIHTDSLSGEFSAMVPPLEYKIAPMVLVNGSPTQDPVGPATTVDLTNPNIELSDTLYNEDGSVRELYKYNTMLKQTYHADTKFIVTQDGAPAGAFGIKGFKLTDAKGDLVINDIYEVDGNTVTYKKFTENGKGVPLFIKEDTYIFNLEGYEDYKNVDNGAEYHVPLKGNVVTINNALSADQKVYVEDGTVDGQNVVAGQVVELEPNQLTLDDEGKATYKWQAGLPNIAEPYTRTISITYDIDGRSYDWDHNGMEGIILGDLPTGNNFVTAGPDKLLMILRDPPGSNSFAEWTTGSSTTTSTVRGNTFTENFGTKFNHKFGLHTETIIGTPGAGNIIVAEAVDDLTLGAKMESSGENSYTRTTTTTVTQTISTSDAPEYVGDQGDVFVGTSTNIIFGKSRNIGFKRKGETDEASLGLDDIITTGLQFNTMFNYTRNYIENVLFPNFLQMRKTFLTRDGYGFDQTTIDNFDNKTDRVVYLTTLSPDDPDFGKTGTYTAIGPKVLTPGEHYPDSVMWVNNQISNWEKYLSQNEEAKVKSYANREKYLMADNISFDSGTTVTNSTETTTSTTHTWDWSVSAGLVVENSFGFEINKFGLECTIEDETMGGTHEVDEEGNEQTTSFSYTLAEDGDDDALSVDVFKYDAYSPIFRTRGGQTCCPYEGKVVTKYYEPGTTIMEATMQIEVPQINVDVPIMNDVPSGGTANYTLRLSNASEIDEDVYYRLIVADETNPDGANLMMDGRPITDSRIIKIPAGQTITKALQLKQTDTSVLDYEKIAIVLGSQCQFDPTSTWDVITDTVWVSAHFVPSSSDVTLALSNTLMNTQTGNILRLTFKDFDRNYKGLKAFRLQYKKQGSTDWTQLKEYVLDDTNSNSELLPASGATVTYAHDLSSFPDGEYLFRVVSVSTYGNDEVYKYSDEIALVKDVVKPRPLGQPEPTDGVLDIGDELSLTFSEPILKGELTKMKNFTVSGVLNGSEVAHETALSVGSGSFAATTEASINLAGKDFSIDTWVNITSAGTLFSHGQGSNKLIVSTDDSGKLVVKIGDNTYTSANSVPTKKWAFLTMNVTADGKLSATVASADETAELFSGKEVATYAGNGPLSIGTNSTDAAAATAAIHELLLWDEAHDLTIALANRSKTKNPSTRHLIGYWKMDEGEGTSIRDYARSRNMTMPTETWYLNNENKAVSLDGSHYISISAAELPTTTADDYTVEFWMRGKQQTGEAQLLQMGDVALWLNTQGELQLTGKGASSQTAEQSSIFNVQSSILDNAWHHIALNVLRQGAAAVYVDGKRSLTTNADNVGNIVTNKLIVGAHRIASFADGSSDPTYTFDRMFKGEVDEIRLWNATMNGDQLAKNRKVRFTGNEAGLMAYYPFETKETDLVTNQTSTVGTANDLTGSGHAAELLSLNAQSSTLNYVDEAPALRTKPAEKNVNFDFTASSDKIVIDIDEDAAAIEGCTLNFTINSVRDENGNYSDPVIWSAFVNRNELVWADDALSLTQPVETSSSVTATIVNKGGKQQMWTLDGMPAWLTASAEYGTTNPKSESTVTFTVSPSTPIGKYEETIYLKGNDGIETPLTINVKVTGDEPLWSVNVGDYEESMNLIGALDILGVPSEDEDDLVAAFINDECRGVAHPKYIKKYDSYFVTMDIYNNGNDDESEVEFKVYDASTGIIYPVVTTSEPVEWEANSFLGRYKTPVSISATDMIEQSIDLENGWNWMSLGVAPETFTVPVVFEKANGKVLTVKSQSNGTITYSNGQWVAKPTNLGMNNQEMYVVKTSEPLTLTVTGHRVKPADVPITVKKGWNWLGYNGMRTASLTEALSGLNPQDGDIIKGQRGVAYFDDSEWIGSLSTLVPGLGYKIQSEVSNDRTFSYPSTTSVAGARRAMPDSQPLNQSLTFTPVDYSNYPANMVLIAQVVADGQPVSGLELGVFAGEECREAAVTDERGLVYITIPGDENCELTFRVSDGNSQLSTLNAQITYETDAVIGTPKAPFIINLDNATGIADNIRETINNSGDVYDLQGRKLSNSQLSNGKIRKGVYIVNGQKQVK